MMQLQSLVLMGLIGLGSMADAQTMMERVKDAVATTTSIDKFSQTVQDDIVPNYGTVYPHTIEPDPTSLETNGQLLAISNDDEGKRYQLFGTKTQEWGPNAIDPSLLDLADAADADPEAYVGANLFSATSPTGELCTVQSIDAAPKFTRSCDRSAQVSTLSCLETPLVVETETVQSYICQRVGAPLLFPCTVMDATPECVPMSVDDCLDAFPFQQGECTNPQSDAFLCSTNGPIEDPLALENYDPPVVQETLTWVESCAPADIAECTLSQTSCPGGPSVVFVNGNAVPLSCGEIQTDYSCIDSTYVSDCALFTDASCTLLGSDCILDAADGSCLTYEDTYECGSEVNGDFDASCQAITVCVAGVCQTIENEANDDFAVSIAHVAMVNDMVKDNDVTDDSWLTYFFQDESDLVLFNGTVQRCGRAIFGSVNCCKDTGWALGTLAQCNTEEINLYAAMEAERTVYMNTYCSAYFFVCTVKKRRYCVYGSKLARVISTEVFRVKGWTYECRALTYAELQSVDFSQLDMSDVYSDLVDASTLPDPQVLTDALADNILATQPVLDQAYAE